MTLGPRNEAEKVVFAEEGFRIDVQHRIQKLMNDRRVTQKELARRLAVSDARVSQIFSDKCNITIRMLARIFYALEDECFVSSRRLEELYAKKKASSMPNSQTARKISASAESYAQVYAMASYAAASAQRSYGHGHSSDTAQAESAVTPTAA